MVNKDITDKEFYLKHRTIRRWNQKIKKRK